MSTHNPTVILGAAFFGQLVESYIDPWVSRRFFKKEPTP